MRDGMQCGRAEQLRTVRRKVKLGRKTYAPACRARSVSAQGKSKCEGESVKVRKCARASVAPALSESVGPIV